MNAKRFLFINGINLKVNQFHAWNLDAEDFIESSRTPPDWRPAAFSYQVGALDRWLKQDGFIAACADKVAAWQADMPGVGIVVCGHSNGAAVACGMLRTRPDIRIAELHLIAAAEHASFDKNGLNDAIRTGRVGRVVSYWSKADEALAWAKRFRWVRYLNSKWGYGTLGMDGAKDVADYARASVVEVERPGFRHSDYFAPPVNFPAQMYRVASGGLFDDRIADVPPAFAALPDVGTPPPVDTSILP